MSSFSELLLLYAGSIPAAILFGVALSVLGAHLVARNREIQVLCLSQGAVFGVLLAIGVMHLFGDVGGAHEEESRWIPSFAGLAAAAATYLASELLIQRRPLRRNSLYVALFIFLMTIGHLVTAFFPALDTHLAQAYFGDLATLNAGDAAFAASIAVPALAYLVFRWRALTEASFQAAFFGARPRSAGFTAVSLVVIAFSIQTLGLLFTVASLFLPTTLLGTLRIPGVRLHYALCAAVSALAIPTGFVLSLKFTRLPTVPTIAFLQVGLAAAIVVLTALWTRNRTRNP